MAVAFFLNMIHISLLILQMCIDWLLFPWHCTKQSEVDPGCEGVTGVLYAANWCSPLTLIPVWKIWVRSSRKEKKKWETDFSWRTILRIKPYCLLFSFSPKSFSKSDLSEVGIYSLPNVYFLPLAYSLLGLTSWLRW